MTSHACAPAKAGAQTGSPPSRGHTVARYAILASLVATPAAAQSDRAHYVQPYVEVAQAVAADL